MAVFAEYRGLPESARGASIALGNFDGLHVGHKAVMEAARLAGQGRFSVATFEPPPRGYFRPGDPPFRIFRPERRNATILAAGADTVFELPFNGEMAAMTGLFLAIGYLIGGSGGALIALAVAAGMNAMAWLARWGWVKRPIARCVQAVWGGRGRCPPSTSAPCPHSSRSAAACSPSASPVVAVRSAPGTFSRSPVPTVRVPP